MSRKTKCCKKYKRSGKYCRSCPLRRGAQIGNDDSRQAAKNFHAFAAKAILNAEIAAGAYSASSARTP